LISKKETSALTLASIQQGTNTPKTQKPHARALNPVLCLLALYNSARYSTMETFNYEVQQALEKQKIAEENNKIIRAAKAQWISNFKAGQIKLNTVKDLKDLIEIESHLREL